MKFFDSLTHVTLDGSWLGGHRYDASLERLLNEMKNVAYRACLVNIAGYQDNDTLVDIVRVHPDIFIPIAGFNPVSYKELSEIEVEVTKLADQGFAGLKLHPRLNGYDPLCERSIVTIQTAGKNNLVVFLDTLFRQKKISTKHPADIIDILATQCNNTHILLLHGGGGHLLDMFEMVRMHRHLTLDLSFTLLRYAGSSIDFDIRFLCKTLDQRLTIGSDFPEYTPLETKQQITKLTQDLTLKQKENIFFRNLENIFKDWRGFNHRSG